MFQADGFWIARKRVEGKVVQKQFKLKRDADRWLLSLNPEPLHEPKPSALTLGSWYLQAMELWKAKGLRETTQRLYRTMWENHLVELQEVPLVEIGPETVDGWLGSRSISNSMKNHLRVFLSGLMGLAVRHQRTTGVVLNRVGACATYRERPKTVDFLTPDQLNGLLEGFENPEMRALFEFLALTGLRISEALALRWESIDRGQVRVEWQLDRGLVLVPLKTARSQRVLPLSSRAMAILDGMEKRGAFIWSTRSGGPLSYRNVLRALYRAQVKAGMSQFGAHRLRKTFACTALGAGVGLGVVADALGHADARITYVSYARAVGGALGGALDAVADRLSSPRS